MSAASVYSIRVPLGRFVEFLDVKPGLVVEVKLPSMGSGRSSGALTAR